MSSTPELDPWVDLSSEAFDPSEVLPISEELWQSPPVQRLLGEAEALLRRASVWGRSLWELGWRPGISLLPSSRLYAYSEAKSKSVVFNWAHLALLPWEEQLETIRHEVAHALLSYANSDRYRQDGGHSKDFSAVAQGLGGSGREFGPPLPRN